MICASFNGYRAKAVRERRQKPESAIAAESVFKTRKRFGQKRRRRCSGRRSDQFQLEQGIPQRTHRRGETGMKAMRALQIGCAGRFWPRNPQAFACSARHVRQNFTFANTRTLAPGISTSSLV
jgi:hypothetical protein